MSDVGPAAAVAQETVVPSWAPTSVAPETPITEAAIPATSLLATPAPAVSLQASPVSVVSAPASSSVVQPTLAQVPSPPAQSGVPFHSMASFGSDRLQPTNQVQLTPTSTVAVDYQSSSGPPASLDQWRGSSSPNLTPSPALSATPNLILPYSTSSPLALPALALSIATTAAASTTFPITSASSSSSSASASASPNSVNTSSSDNHAVPIIIGVILASVVGLAAIAASLSWILRMRHKEGGPCGCFGRSKYDQDILEKWTYDEPYTENPPDLFGVRGTDVVASKSEEHGPWSAGGRGLGINGSGTPYPGGLYGTKSYGQTLSAQSQLPTSHYVAGADDGMFHTPRPPFAHFQANEPYPHSDPRSQGAHSFSPVEPPTTPGMLTVANLAPGDISDGISNATSHPGLPSPWMASPASLSVPQHSFVPPFATHSNRDANRQRPTNLPLSPLVEEFSTNRENAAMDRPRYTIVQGQELSVPWGPLRVHSKSISTKASICRRSIRSPPTMDIARMASTPPRLPTPSVLNKDDRNESQNSWTSMLRSNIFAALGAVSSMGASFSGPEAVAPPSAPIEERLTPLPRAATRSGSGRSRMREGSLRKPKFVATQDPSDSENEIVRKDIPRASDGSRARRTGSRVRSQVMTHTSSEETYDPRLHHSRSKMSRSRGRSRSQSKSQAVGGSSRLLHNVQLQQLRHEKRVRRIASPTSSHSVAQSRSSSVYSDSTAGWTTDRGQDEGHGSVVWGVDKVRPQVLDLYGAPSQAGSDRSDVSAKGKTKEGGKVVGGALDAKI
ncbi:hypothetical protein FRB99_000087 [Tulasnella sp. 403]|nr:hypothetical protein FRB99_000087 [Tulasnella sp. 403]